MGASVDHQCVGASKVVSTRKCGGVIIRKRYCLRCRRTFETTEIEGDPVTLIDRLNGRG